MDDLVVAAHSGMEETNSLVVVLFHSLVESCAELRGSALASAQNVTVSDFRAFVEEMLEKRYTAVTPHDIAAGLDPRRRHFAITFDDGYFNNTLALDVLGEFRVPATFFVSTDNVREDKAFWWDALSRALAREGASARTQKAEINRLKTWTPRRIDEHLRERFGPSVFVPRGDIDRPFTPGELREFARDRWVHLGNHTRDHAILTNCTPAEMASEIEGCQSALEEFAGYRPIAIAYPNGNCSAAVVQASSASGLCLGFTTSTARARLPLDSNSRMEIGRYLFQGGRDIRRQCQLFGARFVPSHSLKALIHAGH